ncbi:AcrR family transcriptional regulator [Bradyrhizobium japonicum]|uniref:TetR/AcrR family transcriptional regulator n=1 Tax=Bradyrhizobium japonicum TaxID=375 RepID=UPI002167D207|nr:TetR/AcrR family transcriptional regulator [Bradyrhizobium japonicum]MCS3499116.1 AcrR family transcriptional regulator [Bradyrhizobium japonicum]MCS3958721.1 AcrR family transcriptional regulator [Bradyrhizobium japonicum]MCS4000476.1 AcrR family transcriptional regulator [Bradyrhizobium japonicum]
MARTKEFDQDEALDAAIGVFRAHGFEGTSTPMLVDAMGIGRQSIYDTFGDKWQLYCAAVRRYVASEVEAHLAALRGRPRAVDGLRAMIDRVVRDANAACLGIGSISEFGRSRDDLTSIHAASGRALQGAVSQRLREAQADGDVARDLDADDAAEFLLANVAGIRIAARGGARPRQLRALGAMALRALV